MHGVVLWSCGPAEHSAQFSYQLDGAYVPEAYGGRALSLSKKHSTSKSAEAATRGVVGRTCSDNNCSIACIRRRGKSTRNPCSTPAPPSKRPQKSSPKVAMPPGCVKRKRNGWPDSGRSASCATRTWVFRTRSPRHLAGWPTLGKRSSGRGPPCAEMRRSRRHRIYAKPHGS